LLSLVTSVYFFSTLLVAVVKAASDDKTRLGNHTIDRVSLFFFLSVQGTARIGEKTKDGIEVNVILVVLDFL